MLTFDTVAVNKAIETFVRTRKDATSGLGDEAQEFVSAAAQAVGGGKQLRARFCHAGAIAASDELSDSLWELCASLEVFQAAALVHDDLIDNSDTRRGLPSAHRGHEAHHVSRKWTGSAIDYGRSAALLAGDLLLAWSDDLMEQSVSGVPSAAAAVRDEYSRMRQIVILGQYLDLVEEAAWRSADPSELARRALRIVTLKSAQYSVEQPLILGALLSGGNETTLESLTDYGRPLGMAFQLRDDLLGVFGDPQRTGKPIGDDLRQGKRTVLIAFAREEITQAERDELDRQLGNHAHTPTDVARLQHLITESGAAMRVEQLIDSYSDAARAALDRASFGEPARKLLAALLESAIRRDS